MLWFNAEKGFGFIQTEDDERLYVARADFLPDQAPTERCKGRLVTFERVVGEGDTRAVNVSFPPDADQRRARPRHSRGGSAL
jgi:cold shock CspA family protein